MSNLIAVLLLFIFLAVPALLSALADAKIDSMNSAGLFDKKYGNTPKKSTQLAENCIPIAISTEDAKEISLYKLSSIILTRILQNLL